MFRLTLLFVTSLLILPQLSFAGEEAIDKADTVWILVSTALVMLMLPGLAIFYAGMARKKNVLATMMQSMFILCLVSILWAMYGYSFAFGGDGSFIGNFDFIGLKNVGTEANGTIPHLLFMVFQGMFAAITVALITGGFAERMKFSAVLIFSVLWLTFVYAPLCHWVWGGGWLSKIGALDFAGGIVVHISCGIAALVGAIKVGKRKGFPRELMAPHNLGFTVLGVGLLWFGWFGFNGGSALAADGIAVSALVVTNLSASMGAITWVFVEWLHRGKPTVFGAVSGAVAGLGSITPAAGFVTPLVAMLIGLVGGIICYYAVSVLKMKLKYDDSLDVFGIHGISGIWGTLSVGLFASIGAKGLFAGGGLALFKAQFIAVVATIVFVGIFTYVILIITDKITGLRVSEEDEVMGLDLAEHGEQGYNF